MHMQCALKVPCCTEMHMQVCLICTVLYGDAHASVPYRHRTVRVWYRTRVCRVLSQGVVGAVLEGRKRGYGRGSGGAGGLGSLHAQPKLQ
eukprot:1486147-Rhodomonas_salina.1